MASRHRRISTHLARRIGGGLTLAMLASLLIAGMPEPALADSLQMQIDKANNNLESVVEQYDQTASLLTTDQAKAATLGTNATRLDAEVKAAQVKLQPVATAVYETGRFTTFGVLLDSDSTAVMADGLSMSETLAYQQRQAITSWTKASDKYRATKKTLDATVKKLASHKADLATKKSTILGQLSALKKLQARLPAGSSKSKDPLQPVPCPYTPIGGAAGIAVAVACAQIGKPYVWAAVGPNTFDCSGLMVYAWGKAGKKLRHYTRWQWDDGTKITAAQLRPGDLVFFFPPTLHHVGMYMGGGWMVNAPHTGDVVRMAKIDNLPIGGYRRP
jgi:cell wall-associated NlpC family hydrolase